MTSDPSDHGIDFDYRGDVTRAVESALARARSGDVQEVAYFAACRAIRDYDAADLSPLASLDDYRADYDASIWNAVNAAVLDAGYDPDELDPVSYTHLTLPVSYTHLTLPTTPYV